MISVEKLKEVQERRDILEKLAHTAAMADNEHLRFACANLLAFGYAKVRLDPFDETDTGAQMREAAKYLDWCGLERTYGDDEMDVHRFHFDRREKEVLSITEAAELLGVSRQRVFTMLKEGKLEGRKVGRTWSVYKESVDARR